MPFSSKKTRARLGSSAAAGQARRVAVMGTLWKKKLRRKEEQLAKAE